MKKVCSDCGDPKDYGDFSPDKRVKTGRVARCKKCDAKRKKQWVQEHQADMPGIRRRALLRSYGISEEFYDSLFLAQNGKCFICGENPLDKKLAIDHDHSCCPGKKSCGKCIRGLLCTCCNTAIGSLKENPDLFLRAAEYIKNWKV